MTAYIRGVKESTQPLPSGGWTAERGRTAPVEELRRHLGSAPPPYLEGALLNPALSQDELLMLIRNRSAGPALLGRVGQAQRWVRYYEVKRTLVRTPRTPLPVAQRLVAHLYWRDLVEVIEDPRVHPVVRRRAEQTLRERVEELSLGERVSLARRASLGLIPDLRESSESRVLRALLGNAKLREESAVAIASRAEVPGEVLTWIAQHPRWGAQFAVRAALVRNARTPIPVALKLVTQLPRRELERLANDDEAPKIVRVGAARRLQPGDRRSPLRRQEAWRHG